MVIPITFQEIRLKVHFFRHFHAFSHNFKLIFYSFSLSISFASGNNYSVAVDIENLGTKSTCTSVALLDENGNDVTEIFVSRMYLIEIARYIGEFTPYNRVNISMTPTFVFLSIKDV